MESSRNSKTADSIKETLDAVKTTKPATPSRRKAPGDLVLAAQLNQAREVIIALRRQLSEQEDIISQLQKHVSTLEVQNLTRENEKLREEHGLKIGQQLVQENGEWWVVEETK